MGGEINLPYCHWQVGPQVPTVSLLLMKINDIGLLDKLYGNPCKHFVMHSKIAQSILHSGTTSMK